MGMYLPKDASKRRIKEAQNARDNRAEVVKALSQGQISRRDAFKWGLFTAGGMLLAKNGFSPFAKSAFAQVPTGVPRTPMDLGNGPALPFTQPFQRLIYNEPYPMTKVEYAPGKYEAQWPTDYNTYSELNYIPELDTLGTQHLVNRPEHTCRGESWHTDFNNDPNGNTPLNEYINPISLRGPCEGRPYGDWFAHQRWQEHFPKVGYTLNLGQCPPGIKFHPALADQAPNSVWAFKKGRLGQKGTLPPPLFKGRYGEPILMRIYNNLPLDRHANNGFGRNEISTHFHNAHNGAESDGASNAFHFPGTFYDYHWGTTLARADMINLDASDPRASGPDGNGGLIHVPGDFRELQGTMWFHDHRFFFTSENVYKGNAAMINYYSGPDRGNETLEDGVNHRLPSGSQLDYGNLDFDVNLMVADWATDQNGQYFFDIFNTDGFLGDHLHVNFQYAPVMEVLPRKYRFRILNDTLGFAVGKTVYRMRRTLPTGLAGRPLDIPRTTALDQNFPNPFNPVTTITYSLSHPSDVMIGIYDIRGILVRELLADQQWAGEHSVAWDGRDDAGQAVASGTYIYQLITNTQRSQRKMVFVR